MNHWLLARWSCHIEEKIHKESTLREKIKSIKRQRHYKNNWSMSVRTPPPRSTSCFSWLTVKQINKSILGQKVGLSVFLHPLEKLSGQCHVCFQWEMGIANSVNWISHRYNPLCVKTMGRRLEAVFRYWRKETAWLESRKVTMQIQCSTLFNNFCGDRQT